MQSQPMPMIRDDCKLITMPLSCNFSTFVGDLWSL